MMGFALLTDLWHDSST